MVEAGGTRDQRSRDITPWEMSLGQGDIKPRKNNLDLVLYGRKKTSKLRTSPPTGQIPGSEMAQSMYANLKFSLTITNCPTGGAI